MSDLKPCPFCGSKARVSDRRNGDFMKARWSVLCDGPIECGAEMGFYDTSEEAIAVWNRRAPPAVQPPEDVEEALRVADTCGEEGGELKVLAAAYRALRSTPKAAATEPSRSQVAQQAYIEGWNACGKAAAEPTGMVMVPVEPTEAMAKASFQCMGQFWDGDAGEYKRIAIAWHAMLAARPQGAKDN